MERLYTAFAKHHGSRALGFEASQDCMYDFRNLQNVNGSFLKIGDPNIVP